MSDLWQKFIENIKSTQWPEWISTVTQIASVWYARKNNVLVYPTGIVGVLLAAYVYGVPSIICRCFAEYLLFPDERVWLV